MSLRIGVTGGIGSGKSTAAALLARQGAWVVDVDAIARSLTATGGAAMPALVRAFGPGVVANDGSLDRAALRAKVFQDESTRATLEGILHPLIGEQALSEGQAAQPGQLVVFDIPLLAESKTWRQRLDRVLVIDCSAGVQIERVEARSGWTADEVRSAMERQSSRSARRAIADAVLLNEGHDPRELSVAVWTLGAAGFFGTWAAPAPM